MINRQNIEIQYLRLLSVTLLFTAASVSDADERNERFLAFQEVREIILDQIHQIGSASVEEGIDWEKAVKFADNQYRPAFIIQLAGKEGYYFEVLPVSKNVLSNFVALPPIITYPEVPQSSYDHRADWSPELNLQLFVISSFPTRAGPIA